MSAPRPPMLIYSRSCRLCLRLARLARALSLGQLELRAAEDLPELPAEWRGQPVLCLPDGRSRIGAEAVIRALPGAVCGALVTRSRGKARHPQT
ncbi:hypothetical protein PVW47_20660 [Marinovum sp. SP66]|uniref:hypothetical protein n=1 Tax=Marinovum TaxID=367771 RepID=UPI00237B819C|nr:hypothetical protein [Marinovum sp. SP66]MDD9742201.1 hypothetical protein [Marinovum sp. SP66]